VPTVGLVTGVKS